MPDAWTSPQALADRLDIQAEVQRRGAKLADVNSQWNSLFRQPRATKPEVIMGLEVTPGMTLTDFKAKAAEALFPPDEQLPEGISMDQKAAPTSKKGGPTQPSKQAPAPDLTMPPAGAVRRIR